LIELIETLYAFDNEILINYDQNNRIDIVNQNLGNLRPNKILEYLKINTVNFSKDRLKNDFDFNSSIIKLLENQFISDDEYNHFFHFVSNFTFSNQ
jgi:hypothetical protein